MEQVYCRIGAVTPAFFSSRAWATIFCSALSATGAVLIIVFFSSVITLKLWLLMKSTAKGDSGPVRLEECQKTGVCSQVVFGGSVIVVAADAPAGSSASAASASMAGLRERGGGCC